MRSSFPIVTLVVSTLAIGCSSTSQSSSIDYDDSRRFLGRDNDVRVDAQMYSDRIGSNSTLQLALQIQNLRSAPIAFDPESSDTSYDPESETITVVLGAEIPDAKRPMNLATVGAGEKKSFAANAHLRIAAPVNGPFATRPRYIRVKLNYLGDVEPFQELLVPQQQRHVTDALFALWLERNESVLTNALPIEWGGARPALVDVSQRHAPSTLARSPLGGF